MITPVGLRGPRHKEVNTDKCITFTDVLKSRIAFSDRLLPIMHFPGIVAIGFLMRAETFLPMFTFSFPFKTSFMCAQILQKFDIYLGICLIASSRGMFISMVCQDW